MGLVDPHTHTVFLSWADLRMLSESGYEALITLSYIPVQPSSPSSLEDHFKHLLMERDRLKSLGLRAFVGIGLHPRCVTPNILNEELKVVRKYLREADVVGEVGIEDPASDAEVTAFRKQIEWAKELGMPVIVHTPRRGKEAAVKAVASVLRDAGYVGDHVVIDHLTPEPAFVEVVNSLNTYMGVTIQPGKGSVADVIDVIESHTDLVDRVLINSDAGRDPSDVLAVVNTYEDLIERGYVKQAYRVASLNAKEFIKSAASY